MLSSSKITKKPNKETTQVIPVQERSGLYLVVEPKPSKCKSKNFKVILLPLITIY